jgi:D-alanine--poly(phosphoribitol) ligase subunit 1
MEPVLQSDPIGRFLAASVREPARPAVELVGRVTTYAELDGLLRRFAACFMRCAAARVVIALPRGPTAYAAMLGAVLGGATYVPVSVATPPAKLARMLATLKPDLIVADPAVAAELAPGHAGTPIFDPADLAGIEPLRGRGERPATAYIIMTSGSTGAPKGVVIPLTALAHYVDWMCQRPLFHRDDRVSQFSSISFDVSVMEIYGALNAGATLLPPASEADRLFPGDFARRSRISAWVSVPSTMELAMTARQATAAMLGGVRQFVFCGEALRPAHLAAIFAANPDCTVINMYGPTETTVTMTEVVLTAHDHAHACADTVALGEPIPGMGLHLTGGEHPGEGEIVLTGPQLASEYLDDPDRTARAFRPVLLDGRTVRGYFSGDWAERRGRHVFFKGRIDGQLKIRGHRIERGEVLARLADCGWPVACVLKYRDVLTAVVEVPQGVPDGAVSGVPDGAAETAPETARLDPSVLRERLRGVLETYAVPEVILAIPLMPRTENGKLDDQAVRAWLEQAEAAGGF